MEKNSAPASAATADDELTLAIESITARPSTPPSSPAYSQILAILSLLSPNQSPSKPSTSSVNSPSKLSTPSCAAGPSSTPSVKSPSKPSTPSCGTGPSSTPSTSTAVPSVTVPSATPSTSTAAPSTAGSSSAGPFVAPSTFPAGATSVIQQLPTGGLINRIIEDSLQVSTPVIKSPTKATSSPTDVISITSSSDEEIIDRTPVVKKPKRRRSKPSKTDLCAHQYTRGSKKNTKCTRFAVIGGVFCSQHNTSVPKEKRWAEQLAGSKILPPKTLKLKSLRFNRIKSNIKYYLYRPIVNSKSKHRVIVKTETDCFRLKVPLSMIIPEGKGYYLWREFTGRIVWKRD